MDRFNRHELETLAGYRGDWCVSIYLPTERTGDGMLQNRIRLKNLIAQAEQLLLDHGMRAPVARESLKAATALLDDADFWNDVLQGVAIFVGPEGMRTYRLPMAMKEFASVGKRFHTLALLPLLANEGKFYVLAASGNAVKLYEGHQWNMAEVSVPEMPSNAAEALNYDEPEEYRSAHTATAGGPSGSTRAYHGQGGTVDAQKVEALEFFRIVDRALAKHLAPEKAPLVFAGVEYLYPIFKKACSYPHLAAESIRANTETWNQDQLHAAAWKLVEPMFHREREQALEAVHRAVGTDFGLVQLERVLLACHQGQVALLVVDAAQQRWGVFDPATGTVRSDSQPRPGNEDLLDLAVSLTLENRGKVFTASSNELPDNSPVAAVLRYPSTATPIPRAPAAASS